MGSCKHICFYLKKLIRPSNGPRVTENQIRVFCRINKFKLLLLNTFSAEKLETVNQL